jgi:hypothetical protein
VDLGCIWVGHSLIQLASDELIELLGVFVSDFSAFYLLAFERFKNWMTLKVRIWKHLSMSFSASHF